MSKRRVTWFVLADGSRARFVTRDPQGQAYAIVEEHESPEAHMPTHELVSDRPGRVRESANAAHHGIEPRHDAHRAQKDSFVQQVASRLNAAAAAGAFDELVLYVAPRALAPLKAALDDATRGKIKGEFPKDLTKIPLAERPRHFAEIG